MVRQKGGKIKRIKASDFPKNIWEYGSAEVKRCLRRMREYAEMDFKIPKDEIEEVVKTAMSVCSNITNDEIIWESLNLILLPISKKEERWKKI